MNWIGVLISCATPAASWPTASSFWPSRSFSSSRSRSASARLASVTSNSSPWICRPSGPPLITAPLCAADLLPVRTLITEFNRPGTGARGDLQDHRGHGSTLVGWNAGAELRQGDRRRSQPDHLVGLRADVARDRKAAVGGQFELVDDRRGVARPAPGSAARSYPACRRPARNRRELRATGGIRATTPAAARTRRRRRSAAAPSSARSACRAVPHSAHAPGRRRPL